jgi:predicted NBD/HSP70 family sugar kinase
MGSYSGFMLNLLTDMYVAVDVGGTKTLVALFTNSGEIRQKVRFETPPKYDEFIDQLKNTINSLDHSDFSAIAIAIPGRIDREKGVGVAFGNLQWKNIPVKKDLQKIFHVPVLVENDANLAGLSEARLVMSDFKKVLYVTISTGIGTGIITNGVIDKEFIDSEGGQMALEHNGKILQWEDFASGKAIYNRFGKQASDIHDDATWKIVTNDIAAGIVNLIAIVQPNLIIIGGGVGSHFDRFDDFLKAKLKKYETPLTPIPPLKRAKRPEEAVLYGCYELTKLSL